MSAARSRARAWCEVVVEGQAIVWVAVMLPLFLAVIGLAIDGGILFDNQRELQNVADGAARAGAMQIDQNTYRSSSGQTVVLDQTSAQEAALQYVTSQGASISATVSTDPQHVVVTASRSVSTSFLRIVGITTIPVSTSATAGVHYGITQGNPS